MKARPYHFPRSFTPGKLLVVITILGILIALLPAARAADLEKDFVAPPDSAKVWCYWWWLNSNVTKEAITRDLEEMKAKGFGGALIFDASGDDQGGNAPVPAGPAFASPAWRVLFSHALKEAERLGLEISLNIQSGWNLGGPIVTPEHGAKIVVFSETRVQGGKPMEVALPQPKSRLNFYRDIAVVAYPADTIGKNAPKAKIQNLAYKLGAREMGGSAPDASVLLRDVPPKPDEVTCRRSQIVQLSKHMDRSGTLRWDAPKGDWIVLRFGCTYNGAGVSTSSKGWKGLVVDYLNADVLCWYWGQVVDPLIADAGPRAGKTWRYVHTDSWECGGMNWTPDFREQFRKWRGYDLFEYLPVMAGKIVDNRDVSNRFLADFRKTIGDCIAENHYRVMSKLASRHGIGTHPESGGPHCAPIDSLRNMGISDVVMSEFWAKARTHRVHERDRFFVKQPASAAHTYGRRIVAAEGFTTIGPHWQETLWDNLKPSFDHACTEGLNRLIYHGFICSPKSMGVPGQQNWAGTHINPLVTWWPRSAALFSYFNRCQFMLQQGLFVADAVYYYGDHVPNFTQMRATDPAGVGPGRDYDVATEEVLLTRMRVVDGRIVLPDGMSYRLLVLPPYPAISLPALQAVKKLVEAGATVIGSRPQTTSSLSSYPACDAEVKQLADSLWGTDASDAGERRVGKGRVISGRKAHEVLLADGVPYDVQLVPKATTPKGKAGPFGWIHRRLGETEIYFVCNQGGREERVDANFRVINKQPEIWDPVSGSRRDAMEFTSDAGRTTVPLTLAPYGSTFVVFRSEKAKPKSQNPAQANFPEVAPVSEIAGPWTVSFDPKWGGPEKIVFSKLEDWTKRPEEGIRHYSGTAVYRKVFDAPESLATRSDSSRVWLDLGTVRELATVRLNGHDLGTVWCMPWRVDVTEALVPKNNQLEIEVINFWPNRLVGDAKLPPDQRCTRTNIRQINAKTPLMPSGLLGPVRLLKSGAASPDADIQ